MTIEYTDFLGHIAMLLFVMGFTITDMFRLRILALLAIIFETLYLFFGPDEPLWIFIMWNMLFMSVNLFQIVRLILQKQISPMTEIEQELYQTLFNNFSELEFLKLMRTGSIEILEAGSYVTKEGEHVESICLIYNGIVTVESDGKTLNTLKDGQLIGEMSFVSGLPATATTITKTQTKLISWNQSNLKTLLKRNPTIQYSMERVFNRDLMAKLTQDFDKVLV